MKTKLLLINTYGTMIPTDYDIENVLPRKGLSNFLQNYVCQKGITTVATYEKERENPRTELENAFLNLERISESKEMIFVDWFNDILPVGSYPYNDKSDYLTCHEYRMGLPKNFIPILNKFSNLNNGVIIYEEITIISHSYRDFIGAMRGGFNFKTIPIYDLKNKDNFSFENIKIN